MQSNREASGTDAVEMPVDPRLRFVETATGSYRQSAGLAGAPQPRPQSGCRCAAIHSAIEPDFVGSGHQDVGSALRAKQWLQNPGSGEFGLQSPQTAQDLGVTQHPTRFGTDGSRYDVRPQWLDSAANRSRTRSINESLTRQAPHHAGRAPKARSAQLPRGDRRRSRNPPCSRRWSRNGSGRIAANSGADTASATSSTQASRRRTPYHQPQMWVADAHDAHRRGCRGYAADVAAGHDNHQISRLQDCCVGRTEKPRHITDHRRSPRRPASTTAAAAPASMSQ